MKIFGKKKKSIVSDPSQEPTNDNQGNSTGHEPSSSAENVPSYFSSSFFDGGRSKLPSKNNAPNVEKLMSKDPATLTSKERRILRRFQERQRESFSLNNDSTQQNSIMQEHSADNAVPCDKIHETGSNDEMNNNLEQHQQQQQQPTIIDTKDLIEQLQGLNSKERRQLLRTWKQSQSSTNAAAVDEAIRWMKEEARRIALENIDKRMNQSKEDTNQESSEQEDQPNPKDKKRKKNPTDGSTILKDSAFPEESNRNHHLLEEPEIKKVKKIEPCTTSTVTATVTVTLEKNQKQAMIKNPTPNGKGVKDWCHLTPEERQRREEQRQMQKDAEERRKSLLESGNVENHPRGKYKHPLNSERRRANRRKPSGKAARILLQSKRKHE